MEAIILFFELLPKTIKELGFLLGILSSLHIFILILIFFILIYDTNDRRNRKERKESPVEKQTFEELDKIEKAKKEGTYKKENKKKNSSSLKITIIQIIYFLVTSIIFIKSMDKSPEIMKGCLFFSGLYILCVCGIYIPVIIRFIINKINAIIDKGIYKVVNHFTDRKKGL